MGSRDEAVKVIKSSLVIAGTKSASSWLRVKFPLLNAPFFSKILDHYLNQMFTDIVEIGELAAFAFVIDLRVSEQGRAFEKAATKFHSASAEDKHLYEKEYLEAFYNFASYRS